MRRASRGSYRAGTVAGGLRAMDAVPYLARTKLALASAFGEMGDRTGRNEGWSFRNEGEQVAKRLDMQAILRRHIRS